MSLVEMPVQENQTSTEEVRVKSLTHWVWTPYRDINNMQAWGINSLLGYRGQAWARLERCKVYPLGNMTSRSKDRQAAEEAFQASYAVSSDSIPDKEHVKYAAEQAAELGESYGHDHGLRVLLPLIGVDDVERVERIINAVQPRAYAIYEMGEEFSPERIEEKIEGLNNQDQDAARQVGKIFLGGSERARLKAEAEYEVLISSMSEASVGKPGISNPNDFHKWICEQLNRAVPERINKTNTAQPVVVVQQDNSELNALRQELAEMRKQMRPRPGPKPKEVVA